MIYHKLKDLLEVPNPCLLQRTGIQNLLLLICNLKKSFQTQFFVSADKLYEKNIDGLSEQEIINKMSHMSTVGIAYQNNHDLDQPEIVNLLVTGFSGTLHGWWDS